ncbi:hypothetical protein BDQ12DRAFT_447204 [Crucibulum laeve]|uniref:Uncharacterized protein n=1 Tax=Crucibulum laeve TaxID=68775 RepID=A0A5C3LKP5_9AGAR|nr:hypothetical protein BDQ12DRAFT_447204 [Crucibulum laeve]
MRSETVTAKQHGGGKMYPAVPPPPAPSTPPSKSSSSLSSSATRGINRLNRRRSPTLSSIPPARSSSLPTTEERSIGGGELGWLKVKVQQSTLTRASGTGRTPACTRALSQSHTYSRSLCNPATSARNPNYTHMRGAMPSMGRAWSSGGARRENGVGSGTCVIWGMCRGG